MKNAFISCKKSWIFGYAGKRFDKKAKINFKIYDVTDWIANNYNTYIAEYFKKWRQSGNEIRSVKSISHARESWRK